MDNIYVLQHSLMCILQSVYMQRRHTWDAIAGRRNRILILGFIKTQRHTRTMSITVIIGVVAVLCRADF